MKQKFDVTGMSCSACSAHVEKAVSRVPGVDQVQVNLLQNSMVVDYEDEATDTAAIIHAVGLSLRRAGSAPGRRAPAG